LIQHTGISNSERGEGYIYEQEFKALETNYHGYRFRSWLEARWAVFFDHLGIDFLYEPEGYLLEGKGYLPDFYLPRQNCFVEIKPKQPSTEELEKTRLLALHTGKEVYTLYGDVWLAQEPLYRQACCYTPPKMYAHTPNGQANVIIKQETADSQEVAILLQKLDDVGLLVQVDKEMINLSFSRNFSTESFRDQEYLPIFHRLYERITKLSSQLQRAHDKILDAFIGPKGSKGVFVRQQLSWDFAWTECSACRNIALRSEQEEDGEDAFLHVNCPQTQQGKYVYEAARLKAAYEAARRERFST
jgi:hypothetical protein